MRRSVGLLIAPAVSVVALWVRRVDRLQHGPDAGVFAGMVRNLRSSLSLTSPTDQFWIRLSPSDTVAHLGHIPKAAGETVQLPGVTAEVAEVTGRAITRIRLRPVSAADADGENEDQTQS